MFVLILVSTDAFNAAAGTLGLAARAGVRALVPVALADPSMLAAALSARTAAPLMRYDEFGELEVAIQQHLATLNATELADPASPSPLGYEELAIKRRVDLAEGLMKHGGYLAVSDRLGVRVRPIGAAPSTAPVNAAAEVADPGGNIGFANKEEKLAAQLAAMASAPRPNAAETAAAPQPDEPSRAVSRYAPREMLEINRGVSKSTPGAPDEAVEARGAPAFIRLDGPERACILLLVGLCAAAFGRGSAEGLDPAVVSALQLPALALCVANVGIAGYGALQVASSGREEAGSPVCWFFKLALTGAGGFRELRRELGRAAEPDEGDTA